jgi:arginine utilization protein RocB
LSSFIQRLEITKDFAQTLFESTVTTVQTVHSTIADTAYNIVSHNTPDSEKLKQLKEKHDHTANQVYDTLREVNRTLGQLASDYFETLEDSVEIDKAMSKTNHP